MKRRTFIKSGASGLLLGSTLAACGKTEESSAAVQSATPAKTHHWKMVTTWPKNFPGLGTGAEYLASLIEEMSAGRIQVNVYGAGELVPAFEIFDAVSRGTAEMGHGSAYYWKGKNEAFQFFSTVPFGMNAQEMNGWLYHGGGMELWQEAYAPFGLIPTAAGNTGVQMAGWFNKEINSLEDLNGLKMRIPGLGGEVLKRAGGTPVNLPGSDLFTSLQSGAIDATEWVNPYNDLAFGLYKAARYYYYPGWHEPGTTLECFISAKAMDVLTDDLRSIVLHACRMANQDMLTVYTARNNGALEQLKTRHSVDIRPLPDDVIRTLYQLSQDVVNEVADRDELSRRIYASYTEFAGKVRAWHDISERAYYNSREVQTSG